MKRSNIIYISLGSNVGDRFGFLQKAIDCIYQKIGDVIQISDVYGTKAWGFESNDFLNACVAIETSYHTDVVLKKLLKIEDALGRHRKDVSEYQARCIDLDIILSSEGIIETENLVVPHPHMQDRKFVLVPLADIGASVEHPILHKNINELITITTDIGTIEKVEKVVLQNPKDEYRFSDIQYLTIEGNIGAGKTSLAKLIAQEFNAKLVLERFEDNPFLPKFYEDMERYAFPLEMSFLADRYQRLQDDIGQFDLFKDFVVSDYDVFKSMIFAHVTLQTEEYKLYKKVFDIMYRDMPKPGLYVYLYQNTERLQENIKKRGRDYEQKIPSEYLENINQGYLSFLKSQSHFEYKIIDISDRDFIANREDYIWLLNQIVF